MVSTDLNLFSLGLPSLVKGAHPHVVLLNDVLLDQDLSFLQVHRLWV